MTTKQSDQEYAFFCNFLEEKYKEAKEGALFEVLKVLELDQEHSDSNLVQAVNYFKEKDGVVEKDAPMNFLSERDKSMVNQNGKFRPELYCMLLSARFADAIENKSAFIQDSYSFKYGDSE